MIAGVSLLIIGILLFLMRGDLFKQGKLDQSNKTMEGELDDVRQANILRDRLDNDPIFRDRMYKRFLKK